MRMLDPLHGTRTPPRAKPRGDDAPVASGTRWCRIAAAHDGRFEVIDGASGDERCYRMVFGLPPADAPLL